MSLSRLRLITFDVTDTLLKFRTSPGKQYGEIGAMFGVRCEDQELALHFKNSWHRMNRAHPNFGRYSKLGWQNWWMQLVDITFAESGAKIQPEKLPKFTETLLDLYKTSAAWQHANGAIELLKYLRMQQQLGTKEHGSPPFVLGVISNFDPRLDVLLRNMKIHQFFDFIVCSYNVKAEKPSKEIFEIAMKYSEMKNLEPNECLHVGDTPITDYLGAKEACWNAALIHEKDTPYLIAKYGEKIQDFYVFPSLFDFHKKLSNNFIAW